MNSSSKRAALSLVIACSLVSALPVAAQSVAPTYPRPVIERPPQVQPAPVVVPSAQSSCPTGDCVAYDLSTQDECAMFDRQATGDQRWAAGLSLEADSALFVERNARGWNVQAYRIRWSNGAWSGWYVAGVNDLDHKYNPGNRTMRRMWSYFADHEHQALACHRRE